MAADLSTCGKIVKIVFILLNFIYMAIGLALVGIGSWLVHSGHSFSYFTGSHFFSGAAILIICGIIIFIITGIGIAGAIFRFKIALYIYLFVLVLIIVLEIVATILGFVYRDTISETATDAAIEAVMDYYPEDDLENYNSDVNDAIDFVQNTFECCGWTNGTDTNIWLESPFYASTMMFPESCECSPDSLNSTECIMSGDQLIYNSTCNDGLSDRLRYTVIAIGGVGVGFAIAQVLPILLSLCLIYSMHKASGEYVTV